MGTVSASWILVAALLFWNAKLQEGKVYYMCGTVLDSSEKGLILSPGFPNHYLPGSHCVWQFFIPAGSQLLVETLDFDIFESTSNDFLVPSSASDSITHSNHKRRNEDPFTTETSLTGEFLKTTTQNVYEVNNHISISRKRWDKTDKGEKQLSNLQGLTKQQGLDYAGTNTDSETQKATVESNNFDEQDSTKPIDLLAPFTARVVESLDYWEPPSEDATSLSLDNENSSSQLLEQDVCPYDVLYISDLVTFSSRFCGSNSPLNKTLVFGSPVEMMEVIMELITITDRGRGFAMLFTYQNQTLVTSMGIQNRQGGEGMMLLAATAAILLAFVLLMALCLSYRQKMHLKRDPEPEQSVQQPSGSQNAALEASELQLVVPSKAVKQWELELASPEEAGDTSHQTLQVDPFSSAATLTDSHNDKVFVISARSNAQHFTFTSFPLQSHEDQSDFQEKSLRRSVTSPASVSEWLNPDYTSVDLGEEDNKSENKVMAPARHRTWSVRTFNSLVPPITQLQTKWRAGTCSGSFTKLVDSGVNVTPKYPLQENSSRSCSAAQMDSTTSRLHSETSASNASYPLTCSAQLQHQLPICNLKRLRPSFGILNDSSDCLPSGTI